MLELINVQKDYGRFKLNCSLEVKAGVWAKFEEAKRK